MKISFKPYELLNFLGDTADSTQFFPPLETHGIRRVRTVESGLDALRNVFEEIERVARTQRNQDILHILEREVDVEDMTTP